MQVLSYNLFLLSFFFPINKYKVINYTTQSLKVEVYENTSGSSAVTSKSTQAPQTNSWQPQSPQRPPQAPQAHLLIVSNHPKLPGFSSGPARIDSSLSPCKVTLASARSTCPRTCTPLPDPNPHPGQLCSIPGRGVLRARLISGTSGHPCCKVLPLTLVSR